MRSPEACPHGLVGVFTESEELEESEADEERPGY